MSATAAPVSSERTQIRFLVSSGVKLGVLTAAAVTGFALLSRVLGGTVEIIVQSLLVLAGGAVAAYLPSFWVQPREIDGIGWACLLAVMGAFTFAVIDTVLLRPFGLYHWTWDAVGGGSGWWYLPVWFMGAVFLAWLGGVVYSIQFRHDPDPAVLPMAGQTIGIGVLLFLVLAVSGLAPFHGAVAALSFALALVAHVPVAAARARR